MNPAELPTPVLVWLGVQALGVILSASGSNGARDLAVALGVAALSCGLLIGGSPGAFLAFEGVLWLVVTLMGLAVTVLRRGEGDGKRPEDSILLGASIRLAAAIAVWLSLPMV